MFLSTIAVAKLANDLAAYFQKKKRNAFLEFLVNSHKGEDELQAMDLDGDGTQEVFVGNDSQANFLFQRDGNGRFVDVGFAAGVALDEHGWGQATMGIAVDIHIDQFKTGWSLIRILAHQDGSCTGAQQSQ